MNDIIDIFSKLNTFNDVYDLLKDKDNKFKGLFLEVFAKYFFKIHHYYKDHIKEVLLYDEVPKSIKKELALPKKDKGIDLLIKYDDNWVAVQCKYRQSSEDTIISWTELSTFFGLSFGMNDKIKRGYFFTNTINLCDEVVNSDKVIPITGNFLHELNKQFFDNLRNVIGNNKITFNKHTPYSHQQTTIDKARTYYKNHKKGWLEYICGSGKTITSYWLSRELYCVNTVIFVPSLLLLSQFFSEWAYETIANKECIEFLLIGSDYDNDLDDKYKNKLDNIMLTTDEETIKNKLENTDDIIVICTYQSAKILMDVCKKINYVFDFGIYDEAHKTVGQINKKFAKIVSDKNFKIHRKLFMTATPKIYNGSLDDDKIISMDNVGLYGECIDTYNFYKAIEDKRLCDYKILTIHTSNTFIEQTINDNQLVSIKNNYNFDELQSLYLASAITIFKCFEKHDCKHMITYHNSIKRSQDFAKLLSDINKLYYKLDIFIDSIDGNTSIFNRMSTLRHFEKSKLGIICSARVLNEGVNIPIIDSECFIDPRSSTIDLIQCIGRAVRLYPGKTTAKIIVPILSDDISDENIDKDKYGNVVRILKSLSTTDEGIKEYFVLKSQNKPTPRNIIQNEILQKENLIIDIKIDEWNDQINEILWTRTDSFMPMYLKVMKWDEENKRLPSQHSGDIIENELAGWCRYQRKSRHKNILTQEKIILLEKINGWYWKKYDPFDDNYNEVFKWNKEHKIIPSKESIDPVERRLGTWCSNRRVNKKDNILSEERIKQLEKLDGWYWEKDDPFYNVYDEVKKWNAENQRIPSTKSKNPIEKKLGTWCSERRKCKKKNMLDDYKINKLENLIGWYWEKNDSFDDGYNNYKNWITENNKTPSQYSNNPIERNLYLWCMRQREYKRNYKYDEEKIKKLEEIPGWYWDRNEKKIKNNKHNIDNNEII